MGKNNFDFLRFAFAFIVVLSHIIDLSLQPNLRFMKVFLDTHVSVTGFFVISGFLISASYFNTPKLFDYFVKRARRLLPAYVFIVIGAALSLATLSVLPLQSYFTQTGFYQYVASNLLFANFMHPCLPGVFEGNSICSVNGALWTIKVEVSFYLVLPILLYWVNKTKHKIALYVGMYVFGLAYFYGMHTLGVLLPHRTGMFDTLSHQLPGFMPYFAAGMLLYHIQDMYHKYEKIWVPIAFLVFVVEYALHVEIFLPMAMGILIMFIAFNFKQLNHFGKYGDFSYGIYIFHFPIIQSLVFLNFYNNINPYVAALLTVLLVFTCAVLSWNFIEKPFLKRHAPANPKG